MSQELLNLDGVSEDVAEKIISSFDAIDSPILTISLNQDIKDRLLGHLINYNALAAGTFMSVINLFELHVGRSVRYLAQIHVDKRFLSSPKYGYRNAGEEYYTW